MNKKGKARVRVRKVKPSGVWIAPDLERKIKGEGGRRGLIEPPYSYYLHLADIALRTSPSPTAGSQSGKRTDQSSSPEWYPSPVSSSDEIPAPELPISNPPKPPKLTLPKPPKTPHAPKPAKRLATKPLQRRAPKKLPFPKPPKRER